jgi:hypothetical protein
MRNCTRSNTLLDSFLIVEDGSSYRLDSASFGRDGLILALGLLDSESFPLQGSICIVHIVCKYGIYSSRNFISFVSLPLKSVVFEHLSPNYLLTYLLQPHEEEPHVC